MTEQKRPVTILLKPHHFIQMRRRRVFALFIDLLPITLLQVVIEILLFIFRDQIQSPRSIPPQPYNDTLVKLSGIIILLYFAFLSFQISRSKYSTFGMRLMKIKAITKAGRPPTFMNAIWHFCSIIIGFMILKVLISGASHFTLQSLSNTVIVLGLILVVSYVYTQPNHVKKMHKPYLQDFFSKLTFIRTDTKYSDI